MSRLIAFISHTGEEAELADAVRRFAERAFPGTCTFFISSDQSSLRAGREWLEQIKRALEEAGIVLVLCTPRSLARTWIPFEAGCGWILGKPVIPICHSGMSPRLLPGPLSQLQAVRVEDAGPRMLAEIANLLRCAPPQVDDSPFVLEVTTLQGKYEFWIECSRALCYVNSLRPLALSELRTGRVVCIADVTEPQARALEGFAGFLAKNDILHLERTGMGFPKAVYTYRVAPLRRFCEVLDDPMLDLSLSV